MRREEGGGIGPEDKQSGEKWEEAGCVMRSACVCVSTSVYTLPL